MTGRARRVFPAGLLAVALAAWAGITMVRVATPVDSPSRKGDAPNDRLAKSEVDRFVRPLIDRKYANAIVVGLVDRNGSTVVAYGSLSADRAAPPDSRTVFAIGNVTQAFTGSLLASMTQTGDVTKSDPVQTFLPADVRLPQVAGEPITLARLAVHMTGLPSVIQIATAHGMENPFRDCTREKLFSLLAEWKPDPTTDPNDEHESPFDYCLLSQALVRASGKRTYEELLVGRICEPLKLADTRLTLSPGMKLRLAPGHNVDGDIEPQSQTPPPFDGAIGLFSTADDLIQFISANMGLHTPRGGLFDALEQNVTRSPVYREMETLPYGWHSGRFVSQTGSSDGHCATIVFDVNRSAGVAMLSDTAVDPVLFSDTAAGLLSRVLGEQANPPTVFKEARVGPGSFDALTGRYVMSDGRLLTVTREGDRLSVDGGPDMVKKRLYPLSENEFFVKVAPVRFTFERGDKGEVVRLILHGWGPAAPAEKLPSP